MAATVLAGRYRLRDSLSSTSMAEVWLASDSELDRDVVVKLLASGAERGRFEREAQAVAGLGHPNIVQLFDFGEEGRPYMVFEYLAGGSLDERLANGDVMRVAREVAAGLAHAHERGVVHRDLKPGNILFDGEGRAKIADFGIARVLGTDTLTDAGTLLGTAAYISPEQVRGEQATPASDVYSFGVILYRLLAGRLPFEAASSMELAALHCNAPPPPLPPVSEDLRRLAAITMSALAKEPTARPADGAALVRALDDRGAADGDTTRVLPPVRAQRFPRQRLALIAAVALLVVAAGGALAAIVLNGSPASAPARPVHSTARSPTTTGSSPATTTAPSTRATTTTSPTATTRARPVPTTTRPVPVSTSSLPPVSSVLTSTPAPTQLTTTTP